MIQPWLELKLMNHDRGLTKKQTERLMFNEWKIK